MATANDIIGFAQNHLGFDRSDIGKPGLEEAQLLELCNQAVLEYYDSFRRGGGEPPVQFQKETGFDLTADTSTTEQVTSATTDFDVSDSSNFPSSGVLCVWDNNEPDYVAFTGNAANNFTGVTGLGYTHESGSRVARLYPLPSDFNDLRSEPSSPFGVRVNGTAFTHTGGTPRSLNFHIYDDGTTKYLHFPEGTVGDCFVRYNAKPTTIDSTDDTVDVPVRDQWFVVWRIIQHCAPILNKFDDYNIAQSRATQILNNALINRNIGKRIKVRPMRGFHSRVNFNNPEYR